MLVIVRMIVQREARESIFGNQHAFLGLAFREGSYVRGNRSRGDSDGADAERTLREQKQARCDGPKKRVKAGCDYGHRLWGPHAKLGWALAPRRPADRSDDGVEGIGALERKHIGRRDGMTDLARELVEEAGKATTTSICTRQERKSSETVHPSVRVWCQHNAALNCRRLLKGAR